MGGTNKIPGGLEDVYLDSTLRAPAVSTRSTSLRFGYIVAYDISEIRNRTFFKYFVSGVSSNRHDLIDLGETPWHTVESNTSERVCTYKNVVTRSV